MANPFDTLKSGVFKTVEAVMGHPASWTSRDGLVSYAGRALLKHPATGYELMGVEYEPERYYMEYLRGEFPGLAERVDTQVGRDLETVNINGELYSALSVTELRDGDTIRVHITPYEPTVPIVANRP